MMSGHNQKHRRAEDRTAKIFLFITVIFITCHIPRLILDIHELINLEIANMCQKAKMRDIAPAWTFIMIYVSHFCLVLNATFNMFIYGFMSQEFQKELKTVINQFPCFSHRSVVIVWNYIFHYLFWIKNKEKITVCAPIEGPSLVQDPPLIIQIEDPILFSKWGS